MKRDDDFLRNTLIAIEEAPSDRFHEGRCLSDPKYRHHFQLLCDEGYLEETGKTFFRLTAAGHDFIQCIREEGIWSETKKLVAETGGNATLEIVKTLAVGLIKKKISNHTGIEL